MHGETIYNYIARLNKYRHEHASKMELGDKEIVAICIQAILNRDAICT